MSSSSDTAISLPAELVDLILNYFDENHPQDHLALGFCSLVSCSWLPRCRHKLFNAVKIGSKTRAQQLDQLLRDPQSTLSRQISRVSLVIDREYCDDTNLADSLLGQLSTGQDINTISLKIRGVRYYVELDLFSICFRHLDNIKSLSLDLATCISPAHMYQLGKLRKIESLSVKSSFYLNAGTLDEVDDCLYPPPSLKTVWLNKPLASKALLDWLVLSPTSLRKIHMEYEGSNSKELLAVYPLLKACCKKLKHLILCSRQPLRPSDSPGHRIISAMKITTLEVRKISCRRTHVHWPNEFLARVLPSRLRTLKVAFQLDDVKTADEVDWEAMFASLSQRCPDMRRLEIIIFMQMDMETNSSLLQRGLVGYGKEVSLEDLDGEALAKDCLAHLSLH